MAASASRRLVFRTHGAPAEVLELEDFTPAPGEGEVLVKMQAAPINPADLNLIEGTYGVKPPLPFTPGIEGTGVVQESRTPSFAPGDAVIFLRRSATWATHTVAAADALFKLPPGLDPLQAAMLKVNPATAWRLLHGFGTLENGDWIVQNAANSGVGRCVIQLAKSMGVRTVSFVRRPELIDELRALGSDLVLLDDDEGRAAAKDAMGGSQAALAFNAVGGESALRLMNLLRDRATHITFGAMGRRPLTIPNGLLIFKNLRFEGLWITRWIENAPQDEVRGVYTDLAARVAAGSLVQPVESVHPLEDFHQALAQAATGKRAGKVMFGME